MASDISKYSQNIDTNFPVKGQDNPSQGFRDNFAQIRLALDTAANEISSVQYLYTATSYVLPKATDEVLGGVIVGDNITVSDGVISVAAPYSLPTASTVTQGGVIIGDNITVLGDGTISVAAPYVLSTATTATLGGVIVGDGLTVTEEGLVELDLPIASSTTLGGVVIGANLEISTGTLSFNTSTLVETAVNIVSTATTSTLGGVRIGDNINTQPDGTISVAAPYVLPQASTSTLGGVRIGSGINLDTGTISVTPYTLPPATLATLGGVIPDGTTINVDPSGVISQIPYILPIAAPTQLGGVRVGNNLSIDPGNGLLSVTHNTATTAVAGIVKVGTNLSAQADGTVGVSNPFVLSSYTTATLKTISNTQTGAIVLITNFGVRPQPVYFDGTNWRTVDQGTLIAGTGI